ncbi:MAG TPA: pyridoxamine 5'-phosphate oxidase family protein [Acidimicrobiia bacterium]|nr:pyridoxamine 5'-phosphate oxidase family protein [Acidimicrobiia bacterium]
MGRQYDAISPELADWIRRQHVFFVATAPLAGDGHVNVSPKGLDTLRILDERTLAYLDLTGSGIETVAHVRENGRITLMWCAFEGPPRILRVSGRGTLAALDDPRVVGASFPVLPGARGVVVVHADRIADSCGYAVPRYRFEHERDQLVEWTAKRTDEELADYRATANARSIDGLPGIPAA